MDTDTEHTHDTELGAPRTPHVRVPLTLSAGLGERLRLAMERSRLRHDDVAAAVGKKRTTVTNWCAGLTEPSLDELRAVAERCNVRPEWLLCASGPMYEPGQEPEPAPVPAMAHDAVARLAADPPPRADLPAAPYAPGGAEDNDVADAPRELTIVRDEVPS